MVEVHPNFSETPSSIEELHTPPENWLQRKSNYIPTNTPPVAQVYKSDIIQKQDWHSLRSWVDNPAIQEIIY